MTEENHFIKRDRERDEEYKRYGIDTISAMDRAHIICEAAKRILDENITNEDEKRKVYQDVKQLYFEYKQQKGSETT